MLRGFAQDKTTLHLSKELNRNYKNLLNWRHILQELSYENRSIMRLEDEVIESDEVFINAGEKAEKHSDPKDPPRIRANKKKGMGTYENDRPPVQGLFGRESKQIRLAVCLGARIAQIQPIIEQLTPQECRLNTDESNAYNRVKDTPANIKRSIIPKENLLVTTTGMVCTRYIVIVPKVYGLAWEISYAHSEESINAI